MYFLFLIGRQQRNALLSKANYFVKEVIGIITSVKEWPLWKELVKKKEFRNSEFFLLVMDAFLLKNDQSKISFGQF